MSKLWDSGKSIDARSAFYLFAGKRWNDNNLTNEGKRVCQAMLSQGAFDQGSKLVKFLTNVGYTDPSYVSPAFYEVASILGKKRPSLPSSPPS